MAETMIGVIGGSGLYEIDGLGDARWQEVETPWGTPSDAILTGTLDGVALGLPALLRAVKLQKRAARVGFDWPETSHVLSKIQEEVEELYEASEHLTLDEVEEEFGDLLFVMANLARHMKLCPETALRRANAKFTRRFERIEALLSEAGKTPAQSDLAEMDALWERAKAEERGEA